MGLSRARLGKLNVSVMGEGGHEVEGELVFIVVHLIHKAHVKVGLVVLCKKASE